MGNKKQPNKREDLIWGVVVYGAFFGLVIWFFHNI